MPHRKFFRRGPRMCLRLCFRKRQMLDVHLLRVFSFCSKTIRRSLISLLRGERVFLYAVGGFLPDADASPTWECYLPISYGLRRTLG